jgi:hypothetical protein
VAVAVSAGAAVAVAGATVGEAAGARVGVADGDTVGVLVRVADGAAVAVSVGSAVAVAAGRVAVLVPAEGVAEGGKVGNRSACPISMIVVLRQLTLMTLSTVVPVRVARAYSVSPRCT